MKGNSAKFKILIAEDRKPMAKALAIKLERAGFNVQIAEDGEVALNFLKNDKFNIVLLDLVMPKIDGFTILAEMQARNIKTPVIVLSNLSQDEDERRAKELGAVDYFIKSDISINEVVKRVTNILSQNKK
ncbi:MAG: response regulator [bacterium]|nr:response regulator [bacterium]